MTLVGKYNETILLHSDGEVTHVTIAGDNSFSNGVLRMPLNDAKAHMIGRGCKEII